jgi:type I restriction enzyme M protein
MLDSETKRKIDSCRDILVGKLPDPKSQIEQITIALIYKFMDDMDKQSEELGGKAKFFTGEFEKYSWNNLVSPKLSGHEAISYYNEALLKMNQNKNIPQLFRDIFKNAYLPYRDPETLKSFLKEIDWFSYDHSEKLGDAFEYLLSVMGSQGDAGQFRTPRHIIDFIVKIVDPDKSESVLDPACGTAGFLISAYKHILDKSKDKNGKITLTPDEKKRLVQNITGYDISPDMVRLSLVNLYLHGFPNPKIFEYDSLSSEERWNDFFEVILANPPFMTPKGGIRPHKRFSIQANRSEVLFVDYIHEHLTPNGKAGIVVPEGIIFQSGTAYKQLRKMLVENSLYAVVSLPAGVFNPYSGVKTSVLLLDKSLAKKTKKILFLKIENDGFGLGAQRREVSGSDLPLALEIINKYKKSIQEGKEIELNALEQKKALIINKEDLSEDFNLSQDRYRTQEVYAGSWPLVELGDVAEVSSGDSAPQEDKYFTDGKYNFYRTSDVGAVHISPNL